MTEFPDVEFPNACDNVDYCVGKVHRLAWTQKLYLYWQLFSFFVFFGNGLF